MLTQIPVADPKQIDLAVSSTQGNSKEVGREDSNTQGLIIEVKDEEPEEGQPIRRWVVQRKVIDQLTKIPEFAEIGTFQLADEKLSFQWNMEAPDWAKANSLQYCMLEISQKNQPTPKKPPKILFGNFGFPSPIPCH